MNEIAMVLNAQFVSYIVFILFFFVRLQKKIKMKTALRINKNMWYSMCILFFNVKFLDKFRTV